MGGPLMLLALMHHKRKKLRSCGRNNSLSTCAEDQGPSRATETKSELNKSVVRNEGRREDIKQYPSTCRVCLKEGHLPIYGADDVSDDLRTLTGINLTFDDTYPKHICYSCHALLQGAVLLRKTAQESEQFLKQEIRVVMEPMSNDEDYMDTAENTFKFEVQKVKQEPVAQTESEVYCYHCKKCDITYETLEEYRVHRMSEEHDNLRKTCPICHNDYNSEYLKKHLALHKNETPYMCDICGKHFVIHGQFTRHRITHFIDDLPFKCTLCPYKGRFTESLKMHMRSHTGEKPYQCPHCPTRAFVNKSNLNKHLLTHSKEFSFKCDQCQKGFHSRRELELHFKVDHSGIKDHVCNLCGKAFGYRKQMMKHQLKVHKRDKMRSGRTPLYMLLESRKEAEAEPEQT